MANITTGSSLRNGSATNHRKIAIKFKCFEKVSSEFTFRSTKVAITETSRFAKEIFVATFGINANDFLVLMVVSK